MFVSYLSVAYLFVCLFVCLCVCLSVCLFVCFFVFLLVCLLVQVISFIYSLSVFCLFVYLFVCVCRSSRARQAAPAGWRPSSLSLLQSGQSRDLARPYLHGTRRGNDRDGGDNAVDVDNSNDLDNDGGK